MRLSVNNRLINKSTLKSAHGDGFIVHKLSISELSEVVKSGFAFSYEYKKEHRSAKDFVAADFVTVDIDNGLTVDEALAHPLVSEAATFIYTTASHTVDHNRFRILFVLARTIHDAVEIKALATSLMRRLQGDFRHVDAARMCYGNTAAQTWAFDRGLSASRIQELIDQSIQNLETPDTPTKRNSTASKLRLDDRPIVGADGQSRTVWEFPHRAPVHCPYHDDSNPSAVIYVRGAKRYLQCFACDQSWGTSPQSTSIDFDALDLEIASGPGLNGAACRTVSQRFLDPVPLTKGLYFFKSPKGTGKTQLLAECLPADATVLLVGHRKALLRNMADRLKLTCYLDKDEMKRNKQAVRRLAICLDSIDKYKLLQAYDFVVLDESEQVLGHILSETISEKRHNCMNRLRSALSKADAVVALDADLSHISIDFLSKWAGEEKRKNTTIILNTFKGNEGQIEAFGTREQLTDDIIASIRGNRRCYITSNSKGYIDSLYERLRTDFPEKRFVHVTAETTKVSDDPAWLFFGDPVGQSMLYDAVLTSPAVGTGVDIRFEENRTWFDVVYGVFETGTTDHFQCDQQLARVRHPGRVCVYVAPGTYHLDVEPNVVEGDLRRTDMFGYLGSLIETGRPTDQDELLRLAVQVSQRWRASQNRLRDNFLDYRRNQGWEVVPIESDKEKYKRGAALLKSGKKLSRDNLVDRLMGAIRLSEREAVDLKSKKDRGIPLSRIETDQLLRAELENFYRRDLSAELIEHSENNRWREKIERYEAITERTYLQLLSEHLDDSNPRDMIIKRKSSQDYLLSRAFATTPIFHEGQFLTNVAYTNADLGPFKEFVSANKYHLEQQYGFAIRRDLHKMPTIQLREFLKLVLLEPEERGRPVTSNGRKTYFYGLNESKVRALESLKRIRGNRPPRYGCFVTAL
jgi:hypothetical protein